MQSLGENIRVKRLQLFPKSSNSSLAIYSHMGGKIVTFVELKAEQDKKLLLAISQCTLLQNLLTIPTPMKFQRI